MGSSKKHEEADSGELPLKIDEDARWDIVLKTSSGPQWKEKSCSEKFTSICIVFFKIAFLLGILYIFVCSLGMLGDAFQLLGGKAAGQAFRSNDILNNPIADLMMGVLVTVLLQSSSTTTSIVVAMVAAEVLPVGPAIFVVMGANIGTSVTNTIVSMGHAYDRDEFRRAFAGATVHDMFNWLCVLILLPVEWLSKSVGKWGEQDCGLLCQISGAIMRSARGGTTTNPELLKKITKPLLKKLVQIDKKVVIEIAKNPNISASALSLLKTYHCKAEEPVAAMVNGTCSIVYETVSNQPCGFLFEDLAKDGWQDWKIGLCMLFLALVILLISLVIVVKTLTSMLKGPAARIVQKVINAKIPKPFTWLTGYLAILVGLGLTMLLQSSSIFTSTMTPLVGSGILHINRMYPLTLGSNIGTTFTAILASLAIGSEGFEKSMQVALCHLFFNIIGIIIWYPVPAMRNIPIHLAKGLGNTTANHRWFALAYILIMFLCVPAAIFALSLAGWQVLLGVLLPILLIVIVIVIINVMQKKCSDRLAPKLRTWEFLPRGLRSLSFYDGCFAKACGNCACCAVHERERETLDEVDVQPPEYTAENQNGLDEEHTNKAFEPDGHSTPDHQTQF